MDEKERANKILQVLKANFTLPEWSGSARAKEPFQTLIRTVLSQATTDRNRDKAFRNLSNKYPITPKALAEADVKEIEKAIRVGGLFRNKSRVIRELSRAVLERFNGSLDFISSQPLPEARKKLMSLLGIGPKTADVVLLFSARKSVVPVDTHVNRVSKRLQFASSKAGNEEIRGRLESLYSPRDYLGVHLLLIALGRRYCRARNPLHDSCPMKTLCPTAQSEARQPSLHRLHGGGYP